MHHPLQIMFILPLMTGHLFWKATILGGLYRGVPLYNKRTQLDTNPRLTLAQTLTLSTGDVVLTILIVGVVTSQWYLLSVTLMHHKIR